jgi:hypothetical protein
LYALAVGAAKDPLASDVSFVYENNPDFKPLPTMGVIFPFGVLEQIVNTPGLTFDLMMLLHGEQYLEIRGPIPTHGTLTSTAKISGLYDKGKAALVTIDAITKNEKGQEVKIFFNLKFFLNLKRFVSINFHFSFAELAVLVVKEDQLVTNNSSTFPTIFRGE